ncbi:TetR family transcriptional regulator [Streptomyces sp. NPDC047315]|uniref:TetR/AcrR family transcriptional regulator n=1 Tax=Streptomyces sp. NPDC047315 TaxID=3155142 RepID=UPI0033CCB5FB
MAPTARPPADAPTGLVALAGMDERLARTLPQLGLRERKKIKTRIAIRTAMYRLVAEQGYEATTVEQIADTAEVSPSTVFRYFPTKEDILLTDEFDPYLEEQLRGRPAGEDPLVSLVHVVREAMQHAQQETYAEVALRTRLILEVPALRARMTETMAATSQVLIRAIADRTGRSRDDLELRVFAAAVLGAMREALVVWAERGHEGDLMVLVDEALGVLKNGLRD